MTQLESFVPVELQQPPSVAAYMCNCACSYISKKPSLSFLVEDAKRRGQSRIVIVGGCKEANDMFVEKFTKDAKQEGIEVFWFCTNTPFDEPDLGLAAHYVQVVDRIVEINEKIQQEADLLKTYPRVVKVRSLVLDIGEPLSAALRVQQKFSSDLKRVVLIQPSKSECKEGVLVTKSRQDKFTYEPCERTNALDSSRFEDGRPMKIVLDGCATAILHPEPGEWLVESHPAPDPYDPVLHFIPLHKRICTMGGGIY